MKHIVKSHAPADFENWKASHPDATFKSLGFSSAGVAKTALRQSLIAEQGGLCCYCEIRIDNGDFHIEHFRPKGQFPELQLDYSNMHACCRREAVGGESECCGHKKKDEFSPDLVSPLEPDCASHFIYNVHDGGIEGTDLRGRKTIEMLNLNSALLRLSRRSLIEEFEDLSDDDYAAEIARHLSPDSCPQGEFFSAIEYLHRKGLLH